MGRRDDRDERREYEGDVFYEVWRSGGNVDRVDMDRVEDYRYDGLSAEAAAEREIRRMRPQHDEQFPEEQFPDD